MRAHESKGVIFRSCAVVGAGGAAGTKPSGAAASLKVPVPGFSAPAVSGSRLPAPVPAGVVRVGGGVHHGQEVFELVGGREVFQVLQAVAWAAEERALELARDFPRRVRRRPGRSRPASGGRRSGRGAARSSPGRAGSGPWEISSTPPADPAGVVEAQQRRVPRRHRSQTPAIGPKHPPEPEPGAHHRSDGWPDGRPHKR